MKRLIRALLLLAGTTIIANAQILPDSTIQKIDQIFSRWKSNSKPGCATSIVIGGDLVYAKGFGIANLEDNTPITADSKFYLASVSKQFTGYAIALLEREAKISLDDDIHKYLPWTDFGHRITVRNLLHHTSGIRDDLTLLQFTGFHLDGILSQELALGILKKQRTLNFTPGEKFAYCNSNYILLAEIIQQITGKKFSDYIDSALFKPLGMTNSKFIDGPTEIIRDRVDSYAGETSFGNVSHNIYTQGDGGMFSSVNDMARWAINFYQPKAGDHTTIEKFTTPGILNNGQKLDYAMGIISDVHRGQKRLMHKGAMAGYKNFIAVYPELQIGIVILGNSDDGPKTNTTMDALTELLVPNKNNLASGVPNTVKKPSTKNNTTTPQQPIDLRTLRAYTGFYTTPEVDFSFTITIRDNKLWLNNNRHGSTELTFGASDDLNTGFSFIDHLVIKRNKKKEVTGLELVSGDISGLVFIKEGSQFGLKTN